MTDRIRQIPIHVDAAYVDLAGRMRPYHLIAFLQNAADENASDFGASRENMLAKGVIWIISRIELEFKRFPRLGEDIILKTWFGPLKKWFWSRYYQVCLPNGEVLCQASSIWTLVDYKTREIAIPTQLRMDIPDATGLPEIMPAPLKIKCPADMVSLGIKTPCYSDIDLNMHMNNVAYVRWLCDALPTHYFEEHAFDRLVINYLNEAHINQGLELHLKNNENEFYFSGTAEGKPIFTNYGTWRKEPKIVF